MPECLSQRGFSYLSINKSYFAGVGFVVGWLFQFNELDKKPPKSKFHL